MIKFVDQLKLGGLAFASNTGAQKTHIITLDTSAYEDDVAALPRTLTKASRAKRIDLIDGARRLQWNGIALCGVRGETASYGNVQRWYWRPCENPGLDDVCKGCTREWHKRGEPAIAGYDRSVRTDEAWPWELPFAWQEVPVVGHPWDVAPGGDPEKIVDDAGRVKGEFRTELRRFQRGPRIVRLVHHTDSDTYSARYWRTDADVDDEGYWMRGSMASAREHCHKLMAQGGHR